MISIAFTRLILLIYFANIRGVLQRGIDDNCFILDQGLKRYEGEKIFDMERREMNMVEMETDNDFMISIRRYSDGVMTDGWFEPETEYVVEIKNRHELVSFKDYLVWLEPSTVEEETSRTGFLMDEKNSTFIDIKSLGNWAHLPPMALLPGAGTGVTGTTRDRKGCRGLVAERNIESTSENIGVSLSPRFSRVMINWRSPRSSSSEDSTRSCLAIVANIQTRGYHATIYGNMGGLRKILCPTRLRPPVAVLPVEILRPTTPDPNIPISRQVKDEYYQIDMNKKGFRMDSMQPKDCCACGTATYKMTFQGTWNSTSHPKDWPHNNQELLHWTNLIGVSHMPSYSVYKIGEPASAGVSPVCMFGDTTVMNQQFERDVRELKGISNVQTGSQRGSTGIAPLFSLISGKGMWTPESMNEKRILYFAVNRTHPVFSMLTMMGPSPDWCTGVSGQSLCLADCSWINKMAINLYPWDAGVVEGDTYIPPQANRHAIPKPIMYINEETKPGNPFTPNKPVAQLIIERIKPEKDWQCTNDIAPNVQIFLGDGSLKKITSSNLAGDEEVKEDETKKTKVNSSRKGKRGDALSQSANTAGSGGFGPNNPLSDPALANMATFLCKVSDWSAWSQCSTTCGIGTQMRTRLLVLNKKNELCQHLPLKETKSCDGIQRVCDYSAPCSLLRWSEWTRCNATCNDPENGQRKRSRSLARLSEKEICHTVLTTPEEQRTGTIIEWEKCSISDTICDPVAICGEGRSDGVECGKNMTKYHYSAEDHACLPFNYLGCKGNRNNFKSKEECESFCFKPVEALPQWRRERMVLLQYRTSSIARDDKDSPVKEPSPNCNFPMEAGVMCKNGGDSLSIKWYYSKRNNRCREFVYNGCEGNDNRFGTNDECMETCMPEEVHRTKTLAKARKIAQQTQQTGAENEKEEIDAQTFDVRSKVKQSQDCVMSKWTGWGPCSVKCSSQTGSRLRSRRILKPSRLSGKPCELLYDQEECNGIDPSC